MRSRSAGPTPETLGIPAIRWQPANCGWEVAWRPEFLAAAEGLPLKNITLTAGDQTVAGEALITRYGLEGGAVYQLGRTLRAMERPRLHVDLKPTFSAAELARKAPEQWRLSRAAKALLDFHGGDADRAAAAKSLPLDLLRPRPLAEAISSAGGARWSGLTADLMLGAHPGVFLAGEMIDWEAPTGGYLLQGCFATGARAGEAALRYAVVTRAGDLPPGADAR